GVPACPETCGATSTPCTSPANTASTIGAARIRVRVRLLDFPTSSTLDEFLYWSVSSLPDLVDLFPPLPSITSLLLSPNSETTQDLRPGHATCPFVRARLSIGRWRAHPFGDGSHQWWAQLVGAL